MRTVNRILVALFCLLLVSCGGLGDTSLEGTWQMVSGTYPTNAGKVVIEGDERLCYKILSADHFAVVEMYRNRPDSLFFAAVGKYSLKNDVYKETLEGCNVSADVGRTNTFESEVTDDSWRIRMTRDDTELDETWVRVENSGSFWD